MTDKIVKSPFENGENFELAQRAAKALSSSSLVPTQYQGDVPNTLIAMEIANRIGASIFAVMQHLYIVHGRPAFDSTFLIATVNSSGRWSPLKFRFVGERNTDDWGCYAYANDKETGEVCEGETITWRMAKAEGWTTKKGSKWQTMPGQMMMYRAASFWTRVYAPELSLGMHTIEEAREIRDAEVVQPQSLESLTEKLKGETESPVVTVSTDENASAEVEYTMDERLDGEVEE